jgi:hypothetical protein
MSRAGFEPAIAATKRPQTYALVREATGIGKMDQYTQLIRPLSDYGLDDRGSIPGRGNGLFHRHVFRPALRPTQPPVQWVPGVLSQGVKCGRGETLTTHPIYAVVVNE